MPNTEKRIKLARGTIRVLWRELQAAGEEIPYMTVYNRIHRESHIETIERACEISNRIEAKKARRRAEIRRIIENAKQEAQA